MPICETFKISCLMWKTPYEKCCRGTRFSHSMDSILSLQKLLREDGTEFTKVSRTVGKSRKSFLLTIPWNLAKPVKTYHGIIVHRHAIDPRRMVLRRERVRRNKRKGQSAVLLQSGLDEKWWADSMECYCYLRIIQDLLADGNPS